MLLGQFPAIVTPEPDLRDSGATAARLDQCVQVCNVPSITVDAVQAKGVILVVKFLKCPNTDHE